MFELMIIAIVIVRGQLRRPILERVQVGSFIKPSQLRLGCCLQILLKCYGNYSITEFASPVHLRGKLLPPSKPPQKASFDWPDDALKEA